MNTADQKNYVTTLSDDILCKLMRHVDGNEWESDPFALVSLFFNENSPFISAAAQSFTMIRLVSDGLMSCNLEGRFIQLNCGADELDLALRVLKACGKHIRIIELSSAVRHEVETYASLISTHCTKAKEIRVRGSEGCERFRTAVNDIVNDMSTHLETLQFREYRRRRIRTQMFSSRLAARLGGNCVQLRSFTYRGTELQRLSHLWRAVGANLEDLNLRSFDSTEWESVLDNISHYCRNLKNITLFGNKLRDDYLTNETVAKFYANYGNQLERASLPSLDEESCKLIAESCRNLRCSFLEYEHEFGRVAALGSRIEKLVFTFEETSDWTLLSQAMVNCSSLLSLEVGGSFRNPLDQDLLHSLFSSKLMQLENLVLPTIPGSAEVLDKIAKSTSRLVNVCIVFNTIEDGKIFELFGAVNTRLEEVTLSEMVAPSDRTTDEKVLDVVKDTFSCFGKCMGMKRFNLELNSAAPISEALNNAFVSQRVRPLKLQLGFVDTEWNQN